jgi:DNA repair protein RadC
MSATTLKKRAYEFKLSRVREVGASRTVDSPELAYAYWQDVIREAGWFSDCKEHLVVLLLNTRHNIEGHALVSIGTLNESLAHPREILAPVLCGAAYGFILMHNHPSGDPSPSQADRQLTRRIAEGAELLGVKLLDHVIAGDALGDGAEPYFSFREMGLL